MFTYNLKENRKKDIAVYTIAKSLRIICLIFSLFIFLGFFSAFSEIGWSNSFIFPLVIATILLFTSLYRDSWYFDTNKQIASSLWGFGPFVKTFEYKYEDITRLELTHFIKGINSNTNEGQKVKLTSYVVLSIALGEEKHEIEIIKERNSSGKLENIASLLSGYTNIELYIDRPRDITTNLKRVF